MFEFLDKLPKRVDRTSNVYLLLIILEIKYWFSSCSDFFAKNDIEMFKIDECDVDLWSCSAYVNYDNANQKAKL